MLEQAVPQPLAAQGTVDEDVVGCDDDLPGSLVGEQRPEQVRNVAKQPFGQEEDAQARRRLQLVVLVDLRELSKQPRNDAAGAEDGGDEGEVGRNARAEGDGEAVEEVVRRLATVGQRRVESQRERWKVGWHGGMGTHDSPAVWATL